MRFASKNTYVLMIGASQYNDAYLEDIPNIDVNFRQLKKSLKNPEILGISESNIFQAKNMNHEATMKTINKVFNLANHTSKTIIVYYAGHGLIDKKNGFDFYLATKSVDKDSPYVGGIKGENLAQIFNHSHAGKKIFIIDACYSGHILGYMSASEEIIQKKFQEFILSNDKITGSYAISSTSSDMPSNFPADNPKVPTYFTGKLIEIISKGLEYASEFLTLDDIYFQIETDFTTQNLPKPMRVARGNTDNYRFAYNRKYSTERKEFEIIRRRPNVTALLKFIGTVRNDKLKSEAEDLLNKIREDNAWRRVKKKDTEQAYKSFSNKFPNGIYKNAAIQQIKYFEDVEDWQRAKRYNSIEAYLKYLKKYANGINAKAAKNRIKQIEDENAWEKCLLTAKKEVFFEYLNKYYGGMHVNEAIQKITKFKPRIKAQSKYKFTKKSIEHSFNLVTSAELKEAKAQFVEAQKLYRQALREAPAHPYIKEKLEQMSEVLLRETKISREKNKNSNSLRMLIYLGIVIIIIMSIYIFIFRISGEKSEHQSFLWKDAHKLEIQKNYSKALYRMDELAFLNNSDSVMAYKEVCTKQEKIQRKRLTTLLGIFEQNLANRNFYNARKNIDTIKAQIPYYENIPRMEVRYTKVIKNQINSMIHKADKLSNSDNSYQASLVLYRKALKLSPNNRLIKKRIFEIQKLINKAFELHLANARSFMKSNIGHDDALEQIKKALQLKPGNAEAKFYLEKLK